MKKISAYILFLISVIFVQGQVSLRVIPSTRDLRQDQNIKLTVILEIQGDDFNIESPVRTPDFSKFNILTTGSESATDLNLRTKAIVYQIVLQPKQTGRIKIGSILYVVNDRIFKTEPFDVFVTEGDKKAMAKADLEDDMYLNLEIQNNTVYKNQPVTAFLKVYSRNYDNFRKVSLIKNPQGKNVNFKQLDFKKGDIEQSNSSRMSSQIVAAFQISASQTGNIEIPSVSALIKNGTNKTTLRSNKINLNIKKLPANAPSDYKNAIGDFKVKLKADATAQNIVGKPINVSIKVTGEGNFRTLVLPKLQQSQDYSFFAPKIVYNTKSSSKGSTGDVTLNYIVIPKASGNVIIKTDQFSFFDPDDENYTDLKSDSAIIVAFTEAQINDEKSTLDKVNEYTSNVLQTVQAPKIITDKLNISNKSGLNYKIILGNLALLAALTVFIFSYKKKKKKKQNLAFTGSASESKNITETQEKIVEMNFPDIDAEIVYLQKLKDENKYNEFFETYDSFLASLESFSLNNLNMNFSAYLSKNKGGKVAEDYRNLNEEVMMEKFAPFHSKDNVEHLYSKIQNLFSDIT